jgi:hypothetical protein
MTPDNVCGDDAELNVKIRTSEIDDVLVIEGSRDALLFLSRLFKAVAETESDGFHLSPQGAGYAWFAEGSTKGLYLRRTNDID